MSSSRSIRRFVPGIAVAAVTVAALGATWLAPRGGTDAASAGAATKRPSLAAQAVEVVKAPPAPAMQPAACRDCAALPAAPAGRY